MEMFSLKRVFLTGASGLVGKEAIKPLIDNGFEVFAISRNKRHGFIEADIFDCVNIEKLFKKIKPDYFLHFAWYTEDDCLTSELNYDWVNMSLKVLDIFKRNGGKKAVFAGTCFEYDQNNDRIKEDAPLNPKTVYASCKNELRKQCELYSKKNDIAFGWGRIFYTFGHGENEKRLFPYIVNSIKNNKKAIIKSGPLIRDYMYTRDIAGAFVNFLYKNVSGCVNICTGDGISIKDFSLKIAEKMKKTEYLEFIDDIKGQYQQIIGNNIKLLYDVGYSPKYDLNIALENIIFERNI
jgi:nucleoside-diphosphate-sugar epimerase